MTMNEKKHENVLQFGYFIEFPSQLYTSSLKQK